MGNKFLKETKIEFNKINKSFKNFLNFKPIYKHENLLSVFSYDSTGFYEHLCLNKPVIMYYNFDHSDLNKNAKYFYDELKKVKIIHSSPCEAAEFINNNYNNLINWWYSNETQMIINDFNNNFNKYTKDPIKNIIEEFKL